MIRRTPRLTLILLTLATGPAGAAAVDPPRNEPPADALSQQAPDAPLQGPTSAEAGVADETAEAPLLRCYRAAERLAEGATSRGEQDAYACDLAVQMARDRAPRELASALTNRALVLAAGGRLEPALADLDAAVQQTPDDPVIHANRGNLLLRLGRPGEALAAHDRAVMLAPNDARGYYDRAFSHRALGDTAQAVQDEARARALLDHGQPPVRPPRTPGPDAGRLR